MTTYDEFRAKALAGIDDALGRWLVPEEVKGVLRAARVVLTSPSYPQFFPALYDEWKRQGHESLPPTLLPEKEE